MNLNLIKKIMVLAAAIAFECRAILQEHTATAELDQHMQQMNELWKEFQEHKKNKGKFNMPPPPSSTTAGAAGNRPPKTTNS